MFHNFWTRKMLGEGESVDDFIEVTEAQKAAFEKAASEWVRPPQAFIDEWNEACIVPYSTGTTSEKVGQWNEATGYFELNGILNITYKEAIDIKLCMPRAVVYTTDGNNYRIAQYPTVRADRCRTLIPILWELLSQMSIQKLWVWAGNAEVLRWPQGSAPTGTANVSGLFSSGHPYPNLHTILGTISVKISDGSVFKNLKALETIKIYARDGLKFNNSPNLSFDSVKYMVDNPMADVTESAPATITVHADVFAKLTGDTSNAAASALSEEDAAKWQQLLTDAAAKYISFAAA